MTDLEKRQHLFRDGTLKPLTPSETRRVESHSASREPDGGSEGGWAPTGGFRGETRRG